MASFSSDVLIEQIEAFLRDQKLGETVAFLLDNRRSLVARREDVGAT